MRAFRRSAIFYFEEEPGRRSAAKLLTKDEPRRMAVNFAKWPRSGPRRSSRFFKSELSLELAYRTSRNLKIAAL
jgi:hypothetical protein